MDTRLVGRVIDIARSVSPVLAVTAAALDPKQSPSNGAVRAQVAARLADGTFRVLIDGKALKLALPDDVKAGDILQLRVVGRGNDSASSGTADASSVGRGFSTAGQLVAELAKQPTTAPPRQSQPVVAEPPDSPESLAAPLARAVERSGLFYESHQARWVNGEFPLERLLEEPQAQAGKPQSVSVPTQITDSDPDIAPSSSQQAPPRSDERVGAENLKANSVQDPRDIEKKPVDRGNELLARETVPFVRQQLDTLETRHLTWLGEIWPGQPMRWQIGEEPEEEDRPTSAEHEWDSRFALDLPALGNVGAELALAGNRLRIRLSAQDESTVALMRDHSSELTRALEAAGIDALSLEVQHRASSL